MSWKNSNSDQRLHAVIESAPLAMVMIDQAGKIVLVNTETEKIFGYQREELLDRKVEILVPERYREQHPGHRASFLAKPIARRMGQGRDLFARRKDGSEFPVEIGLNPLTTEDGLFVLSAIADITERKNQENELKKQTADLKRANDELEQFAYVASHDLKQPLRGIENLAKWIAEDSGDSLSKECQEDLTQLQRRVRRMELLLDDLLQYSRAGRVPHRIEQVDAREVVEEVIALLDAPSGILIEFLGETCTLHTERAPLEQVLRNLIGNAIKHGQANVGRVEINTETQGSWIEFAVADDGPGIAPQFHERIFRMFQTLRPRDEVEGSGMGLAIIKKLIENKGGNIRLESAEGRGATFRFTWPVSERDAHGSQ